MKLDDIHQEWKNDCVFDRYQLDTIVLNIPELHHKYLRIYSYEKLAWKNLKTDLKVLTKKLNEIYMNPTKEDWNVEGRVIPTRTPLKIELVNFVETDPEYIALNYKINIQEMKIESLESILKQIHQRNYQIQNALKFMELKKSIDPL